MVIIGDYGLLLFLAICQNMSNSNIDNFGSIQWTISCSTSEMTPSPVMSSLNRPPVGPKRVPNNRNKIKLL